MIDGKWEKNTGAKPEKDRLTSWFGRESKSIYLTKNSVFSDTNNI